MTTIGERQAIADLTDRERLGWQAVDELKGAVRPLLDAAEYSEHSEIRQAFNHAAVLAGKRLDIIQNRRTDSPRLDGETDTPDTRFLSSDLDAQIEREGRYSSYMIRAGLLRDILDAHTPTTNAPVADQREAMSGSEVGVALGTTQREAVAKEIAIRFARRPWDYMADDDRDLRVCLLITGAVPEFAKGEMTKEAALEAADAIIATTLHPVSTLPIHGEMREALESDPDLGKIGPGHVCKHGIRWPHSCGPCDNAAWENRHEN